MKSLGVAVSAMVLTLPTYAQDADPPESVESSVFQLPVTLDSVVFQLPTSFVDVDSFRPSAREFSLVDRATVDLSDVDLEFSSRAESSRLEWAGLVDAVLVDAVSVRRAILVEAADYAPRLSSPALREDAHLLSLSIGGRDLVFAVIESIVDRIVPHIRHVTAVMLSGDGYVRFALDEPTGKVVGTVQTDTDLYRILPSESDPVELVFRIPPREVGSADRYLALTQYLSVSTDLQQLEQRHLVAEALADIQPRSYSNRASSGSSRVQLGLDPERTNIISRVDVSRLGNPDTIARLLAELAPLVGGKGDEQYEIVGLRPRSDGQEGVTVEFRQLVNDIPLINVNHISLNQDGKVLGISVYLLDLSEFVVADLSLTTLEQAEQLALAEIGLQDSGATVRNWEVVYDYDRWSVAGGVENRLVPTAQFVYVGGNSGREEGRVLVRMHSGEVMNLSRSALRRARSR